MARKARSPRQKKSWAGCGCPSGSIRVNTKGRGRGWVCQSKAKNRRGMRPFVKATCR